jgi:hypothetical protein
VLLAYQPIGEPRMTYSKLEKYFAKVVCILMAVTVVDVYYHTSDKKSFIEGDASKYDA